MGGLGSGNYYRWRGKKTTVEECRHLDANRWMREGILQAGVWQTGNWCWFRDAQRTEKTAEVTYEVNTVPEWPWVRLFYRFPHNGVEMNYKIFLTTTRPGFGGLRWWFLCPLSVNGRPCGRRVARLYLDGKYFGCRHCHDLTYTSCQEHDKRVDALRKNPELLWALVENPENANIGQLGLALKALR
jgi:hypothetical protein